MSSHLRSAFARCITRIVIMDVVVTGMVVFTGRGYAQTSDPMTVVTAFHTAVNAHDVDAALAFFAPDAVVQFPNQPPPNVHRGTQEIRAWLQGDADQHIQVTMSNLQIAGERLTWDAGVVVDDVRPLGLTLNGSVEATIQGGKFTLFAFTLSEETLAKLQAATSQPQALPRTGDTPLSHWWLLVVIGLAVCGLGLRVRARA